MELRRVALEEAPLRDGLAAAAAELARAAAHAHRLQHSLSPLLRRGGEAAEAAQALDDLTQHLDGLSGFLAAIARDCPAEWGLDVREAAAGLTLHAQKLRLVASAADAEPVPAPVSGDLELW